MNHQRTKTPTLPLVTLYMGMLLVFCAEVSAGQTPTLKFVRTLETDKFFSEDFIRGDNPDLSGVGFPPGTQALIMLNQPSGHASIVLAAPPKDNKGEASQVTLVIPDAINVVYDSVSKAANEPDTSQPFLLDGELDELIITQAGPPNVMDASKTKRFDSQDLDIVKPQGMTIVPGTGQLFVLDSAGSRLVSIQPKPGGEFTDPEVTAVILGGLAGELRGIAFNPSDNDLYVLSLKKKGYPLSLDGDLIASLNLSRLPIGAAQGLFFGPSMDQTDDSSICHLDLLTAQDLTGEVREWAL